MRSWRLCLEGRRGSGRDMRGEICSGKHSKGDKEEQASFFKEPLANSSVTIQ